MLVFSWLRDSGTVGLTLISFGTPLGFITYNRLLDVNEQILQESRLLGKNLF